SIPLGKQFTWNITSVSDDATAGTMTVKWTVTRNGSPIDPCNSDLASGQVMVPSTAVMDAATNDGQPGIMRSYMQGNDYVLGQATNEPGQPTNVNIITSTGGKTTASTSAVNTTCAANVATTTFSRGTVPAGATVGIVAFQGKPGLPLPASVGQWEAYPYAYMYVRVPVPTFQFNVGQLNQTVQTTDVRRTIVDVEKCTKCHVGSLYQHGNTRVDNTLMCTVCHNSASSEQSVRVGMGVTASEAYDGLVGQTFELKTMLHRIHTAGVQAEATPLVIYRNRGIYAWAPDVSMLGPNWATGPVCGTGEGGVNKYWVYGADQTNPNACQPFNFFAPTYPRYFFDCTACHTTGSVDDTPQQSQAVATTLNAGSTTWINQLDDTLQGASAAACTTCHTSTDAKGHAYQNGWTPQVFPQGRQTIIDTK
ncbi:MAG TPA: hypothetical protein PK163_06870, partial [Steroidobacteraceae bacterium]|nr:hypothetical protein [Steroidobacteraceae bacterium]